MMPFTQRFERSIAMTWQTGWWYLAQGASARVSTEFTTRSKHLRRFRQLAGNACAAAMVLTLCGSGWTKEGPLFNQVQFTAQTGSLELSATSLATGTLRSE